MGILVMGQGYPGRHTLPNRRSVRLDDFEKQLATHNHADDDDIIALREENAQLRELVVRLSRIVARSALERK
jgi:hypothetical protein